MARTRGNSIAPRGPRPRAKGSPGRLPELLRRALALGFSGFYVTEEALRRALGDSLPKDWIDFALEQSERSRTEFVERLAGEIARSLETLDLAGIAERLLKGHTIEVNARIRFVSRASRKGKPTFEFKVARAGRKR